ncbi:MAG: peptidylprolyl isomerase [Chitinispirillales bacterium]|jgi:parvulin-like peptidyl-prolyl isomerase|nr:peptidylprolyl isomerase [Chitinispirillales bacterium]
MIQKMREMAPMLMIVILVAFVGGTLFLDWGMNVMGQGSSVELGRIDGEKITIERFDRLVNMERLRLQDMSRDRDIPPEHFRMIPGQVWEQEVSRILLDRVIKRMRLETTDQVVFEYLKRNPIPGLDTASAFQTDGAFDTTKYIQWLNTPQTYTRYPWMVDVERQVSNQIMPAQKLEALLKAGAFNSPTETVFEHRQRNDRATFEYFKVPSREFRGNISDDRITEKMINDYYAANRNHFQQEEQVDLYFLRLAKTPTARDLEINREALMDIKKRIESGEMTFETAAEYESDDEGTSQNGGSLGWFERGRMVREFDEAAFTLEPGVISDPIKTTFGYHIIKVEERGEPDDSTGEFHSVRARHILIKDNPSNETLDALSDKADEIRRVVAERGFVEAAKEFPTTMFDSTGFFNRGDIVPKIGYLSGAGVFAFGRRQGGVSEPLENQNAIYVLGVRERVGKGIAPLSFVRGRIVEALKDTLAMEEARTHAQKTLERIKGGATLADIRDSDEILIAGLAENQAVSAYIPQIGFASRTAAVALSLPEGAVSSLIAETDGYSVVRVVSRGEPSEFDPTTPQARQLAEMTGNMARQTAHGEWFRSLRNNAKIVNNVDRFYLD